MMGGKVASVAELRKALKTVDAEMGDGCYRRNVLKLVGEFEAGVRGRIDFLDRGIEIQLKPSLNLTEIRIDELRRVLGGGAARGER